MPPKIAATTSSATNGSLTNAATAITNVAATDIHSMIVRRSIRSESKPTGY